MRMMRQPTTTDSPGSPGGERPAGVGSRADVARPEPSWRAAWVAGAAFGRLAMIELIVLVAPCPGRSGAVFGSVVNSRRTQRGQGSRAVR